MEFMTNLQNGLDDLRPSLFELLSEQQLAALVPPSLRYLLVITTQRYPRYLLRVLNSFDELYALLTLVVERHFLTTYAGTFTENFYGLKRERVPSVRGGEVPRARVAAAAQLRDVLKLRSSDVWRNLALVVGLPYLKRKLDESYDIHVPRTLLLGPRFGRQALAPDATLRQRVTYYYTWFLRRVYPSINAAYYFSLLAFNLAYLFSGTRYSSPFLWLVGARIRRVGIEDHRALALAEQAAAAAQARSGALRPGQTNSFFSPTFFVRVVFPRILSSLRLLLPTSIFALKFLEWWHASDFARQLSRKATEGLALPLPTISGLPNPHLKIASPQQATSAKDQPTNSVSLARPPGTGPSPSAASAPARTESYAKRRSEPPISTISHLPVLTVSAPTSTTSALCPICVGPIINPTAAQTGFVYCYQCIYRWIEGSHDRQVAWMEGAGQEGWGEEEEEAGVENPQATTGHPSQMQASDRTNAGTGEGKPPQKRTSRDGRWESGKGRDAVTGRRLLGGTECLRRVIV